MKPPQALDQSLSGLISTVLETDFLNCLERTRKAIVQTPAGLGSALTYLIQDCQTLGEILQLDWLLAAVSDLEGLRSQPPEQQKMGLESQLDRLETCRQKTLANPDPAPGFAAEIAPVQAPILEDPAFKDSTVKDPILKDPTLEAQGTQGQTVRDQTEGKAVQDQTIQEKPIVPALSPQPVQPAPQPQVATMRVPVQQLDRLANTVGDLLIQSERVDLDQRRLRSASQGLKKQTRQFYQLRERIQNCYDELLLPGARFPKFKSMLAQAGGTEKIPSLQVLGLEAPTSVDEFDPLELDRFTDLHSLLQDLQEFLARIDEYADDIGLYVQSAQESHDRLKQELGTLREGLTAARMVPFVSLADRFRRALWDLNQRYNKQVKFVVQGGDTEIDRAVLDALYDPLLHLIRNAFDHGQEPPSDRQKQGKSPQGKVILKAVHSGTTVIITVTDDGRGIDLAKVKTIAQRKGLLSSPNPSPQECLNCLFMPGFSTATQAGELSGRGVGLDVVKGQVENLRGSVQVQTRAGKGTRFTLRVPSTLNILPLLLCQQYRDSAPPAQIAIPSGEVLEIVELSPADVQRRSLHWRSQTLTILALGDLLPVPQYGWQVQNLSVKGLQNATSAGATSVLKTQGSVGIILRNDPQALVLEVDLLLEEREMVLKSLDPWLAFPNYIAGCTVLPQGQVVPVLSPEAVTPQSTSPLPQVPPPQERPTLHSRRRALVVDDSAAARRWVTHALQPLGYEVIQCRDGQEAWEQLQGGMSCDLLVCDVEMPRMDGFQLLHHLRQDDRWATLPVAMLTSRQSDRHRQQAESLGASGYFVKPLGVQDLVRSLEQSRL